MKDVHSKMNRKNHEESLMAFRERLPKLCGLVPVPFDDEHHLLFRNYEMFRCVTTFEDKARGKAYLFDQSGVIIGYPISWDLFLEEDCTESEDTLVDSLLEAFREKLKERKNVTE